MLNEYLPFNAKKPQAKQILPENLKMHFFVTEDLADRGSYLHKSSVRISRLQQLLLIRPLQVS